VIKLRQGRWSLRT